MTRNAWPTVVTGDGWSASQNNSYGRDNDAAYWVYASAGDMAYATASNALAKLAIGASGAVMTSTGSAPQWTVKNATPGMLHTKGTVDFAPAQTITTTWADITSATLTLTIGVTSTIVVIADVVGKINTTATGRAFAVRALVGGVADANPNMFNGSSADNRYEVLHYVYYATGVAAGAVIVKLQSQHDSSDAIVNQGRLQAFAFAE